MDPSRLASWPDDEFFRELEARRTRALVERNLPMLEQLHGHDYQLITPAGKVLNREAYFEALRAGPFYSAWRIQGEVLVRRSQGMAMLRYRACLEFPSGRSLVCWHTDSYELNGADWQAVWSQATEIRPIAQQT